LVNQLKLIGTLRVFVVQLQSGRSREAKAFLPEQPTVDLLISFQ